MREKKRLSWWEPRPYSLRQWAAQLMKSFGPKSWLRVFVVVAVLVFAGAFVIRRLIPELDVDWLDVVRALAISIAVGFVLVAFMAILGLLPRRITLGLKQFKIESGPAVDVVPFKRVRRVSIEKDGDVAALVIEIERGTARIRFPRKLDVELLMRMLSERLEAEWSVAEGVPSLTPERSPGAHTARVQ